MWLMTLGSLGVYGLFLLLKIARELRAYLGGEEIEPVKDLLLTVFTFGIYGARKYGAIIQRAQQRAGLSDARDQGLSFLGYSLLLGYGIKRVQEEMNRVWEGSSEGPATF